SRSGPVRPMSPGEGVEWQSVLETASRLRDLLGKLHARNRRAVGGYWSRKIHDFSSVLCKLCEYRSDRRVFMGPVEPGAGQQPARAPVQPGMHPVAVEFDFVQ